MDLCQGKKFNTSSKTNEKIIKAIGEVIVRSRHWCLVIADDSADSGGGETRTNRGEVSACICC